MNRKNLRQPAKQRHKRFAWPERLLYSAPCIQQPSLGWRNWYTRKIKDLVPKGLRVRVPSRAPSLVNTRVPASPGRTGTSRRKTVVCNSCAIFMTLAPWNGDTCINTDALWTTESEPPFPFRPVWTRGYNGEGGAENSTLSHGGKHLPTPVLHNRAIEQQNRQFTLARPWPTAAHRTACPCAPATLLSASW